MPGTPHSTWCARKISARHKWTCWKQKTTTGPRGHPDGNGFDLGGTKSRKAGQLGQRVNKSVPVRIRCCLTPKLQRIKTATDLIREALHHGKPANVVNKPTNLFLSKSAVVFCFQQAPSNPPILSIRTLPPSQPIQHIPRHLLDQSMIIQPIRPIRRTDMKDRPAARKTAHYRVAVRHLGDVFRRGVTKEPDGGKF